MYMCMCAYSCVPCNVSPGNAGVAAEPPAAGGPGGTGAKVHSGYEPAADVEAAC